MLARSARFSVSKPQICCKSTKNNIKPMKTGIYTGFLARHAGFEPLPSVARLPSLARLPSVARLPSYARLQVSVRAAQGGSARRNLRAWSHLHNAKKERYRNGISLLARHAGFEPATYRFVAGHSIH